MLRDPVCFIIFEISEINSSSTVIRSVSVYPVRSESSSLQTGVIPSSHLEVIKQADATFDGLKLWKLTTKFEIQTRIRVSLLTFRTFL